MITAFSTISLDNTLLNITGSGVLQVGPYQVVYTYQTGAFGASGNFYPLNSNPSGYITTGQTGAFGGGSTPTGNLTGVFYPLLSNPSGYITTGQTGSFGTAINTGSLTGQFYPLNSNPDNYITSLQTGTFITSSQTGAFASVINLGLTGNILQLEINSLNSWSGGSTGLYYPLSSNPLNYVNNIQSGSLTGQFYPLNSNPSNYVTTSQTGIFTSVAITGSVVQSYVNLSGISGILVSTGISGLVLFNGINFVQTSQTGAFASSINLNSTGSYLIGLINASSAGVSSLNSASGALTLVGAGNVSVSVAGETITISGNTGIYSSFITTGQTGAFYPLNSNPDNYITNIQTGTLIGQFYPLNSNPDNYITSAQTGNFITTNQTGIFTSVSITGVTVQSYINLSGISGILVSTGISGLVLFNGQNLVQISQTGTFITSSQTGAFSSAINLGITGNTLQLEINSLNNWTGNSTSLYYPYNSNPNAYITTGQTGAFGGGTTPTGNLTGAFYPLITNPSGYITINQTGQFYSTNNPSGFITTGQTGAFAGGSTPTGNLTGAFYPLNSNPSGYLTSYNQSGAYIFNTNITSGITNQFISFPTNLGNNPIIIANLNNISGNFNIEVQSSGITSSGYWAQFSNTILDNNYVLTTIASLSTATGLATTVIVNNTNYNVTGITGSGILSYIPMFTGNGSILTDSIIYFTNGIFQSINISGNINNYTELNLQNFNNGVSGSADLIATNDIGNENIWYVDVGINGSQYNSQYVGNSGDGYLYSSGNDFYIGNVSSGRNLYFFNGNTAYNGSMANAVINNSGFTINSGGLYVSGSSVITQNEVGTGLQIISTGNNIGLSTYFNQQFLTGLQLRTAIPSVNTYANILSGNIGQGTWLVNSNILVQTPPRFVNFTAKLWSGIGAFFAEEISIPTGSATISGYGTISLNGIITNPASSMPLVLSCAATTGNLAALPAPIDNLTAGIHSGVSTYINAIRLY